MGDVDINVKNFIKINSVFSQLFEKGIYHGKIRIDPARLAEIDSANQDTVNGSDGNQESLERTRDVPKIAMLLEGSAVFQVIMGVEPQTDIHYYMPVRCMELDALSYSAQCKRISQNARESKELKKYAHGVPKGTMIIPVVTLVFYFGAKPWDGPMSIYDMLNVPDEAKRHLLQAVPDYRMNLIDARHMTVEQIDEFEGDLKAFLLMLQDHYDEERLKTALAMHRETWYALSKIKNDDRYREYIDKIPDEDLKGGIYMDTTLDYIEKRGEKRGVGLGIELYRQLANDGRLDEWNEALKDNNLLMRLFKDYSLFEDDIT